MDTAIYICTLVFLFSKKLCFPKGISLAEIVRKCYGSTSLTNMRNVEKLNDRT